MNSGLQFAHSFNQFTVLRVQFQQLLLLGQFEVFETEGRTDRAPDEAETALGGYFSSEPLLRQDDHLHLVLFGKLMDGQVPVRVDNIDIERFARVEIPDFHHVVQTMERRYVVGGQHVVDGGDRLVACFIIAELLAVITSLGMWLKAKFLFVFCSVHIYFGFVQHIF